MIDRIARWIHHRLFPTMVKDGIEWQRMDVCRTRPEAEDISKEIWHTGPATMVIEESPDRFTVWMAVRKVSPGDVRNV